jgi:hypothetical protein
VNPREVAAGPNGPERDFLAALGSVPWSDFSEWFQVIVRIDGRHGVDASLDAQIGGALFDVFRHGRGGKKTEQQNQYPLKSWDCNIHN